MIQIKILETILHLKKIDTIKIIFASEKKRKQKK